MKTFNNYSDYNLQEIYTALVALQKALRDSISKGNRLEVYKLTREIDRLKKYRKELIGRSK